MALAVRTKRAAHGHAATQFRENGPCRGMLRHSFGRTELLRMGARAVNGHAATQFRENAPCPGTLRHSSGRTELLRMGAGAVHGHAATQFRENGPCPVTCDTIPRERRYCEWERAPCTVMPRHSSGRTRRARSPATQFRENGAIANGSGRDGYARQFAPFHPCSRASFSSA